MAAPAWLCSIRSTVVGLPVVGWRSGNLPNLVEDGREGCVVSTGDVAGLSAALLRLSTDDDWRDALTAAARERGRRLPTWADAADAFFGALRTLTPTASATTTSTTTSAQSGSIGIDNPAS